MVLGHEFAFRAKFLKKLQRAFLHKPVCSSYEEEVRVVMCICGVDQRKSLPSGTFTEIVVGTRSLYTIEVGGDAIREIYVGLKCSVPDHELLPELRAACPKATLFRCKLSADTWGLERTPLP